jgi:hypothetical protein
LIFEINAECFKRSVMLALVAGIHALKHRNIKDVVAGTSPAMTLKCLNPGLVLALCPALVRVIFLAQCQADRRPGQIKRLAQ